jgi:hypothetical protein
MAQRSDPSAVVQVRGRQVNAATDHRLDTYRAVWALRRPAAQVAPQQQGAQLRSLLGVPNEPEHVFAIDDRNLVASTHQCADGRPVVGAQLVESAGPLALGVVVRARLSEENQAWLGVPSRSNRAVCAARAERAFLVASDLVVDDDRVVTLVRRLSRPTCGTSTVCLAPSVDHVLVQASPWSGFPGRLESTPPRHRRLRTRHRGRPAYGPRHSRNRDWSIAIRVRTNGVRSSGRPTPGRCVRSAGLAAR